MAHEGPPMSLAMNWIKVWLPALYAWQIHGLWIGAAVFAGLALVSGVAAWACLAWTEDIFRNTRWARNAIMVLAFIAVAVSGGEIVTMEDIRLRGG